MSDMKDVSTQNDKGDNKVDDFITNAPTTKEVPRHPKWCPDCLGKGQRSQVKIFSLNEEKEAIYMCSNMQCVWPLATHTAEQIYGIYDPISKKEAAETAQEKRTKHGESNEYFNIQSPLSPIPTSPQQQKNSSVSHNDLQAEVVDSQDKTSGKTVIEGYEGEKVEKEGKPQFLRPISTAMNRSATSNLVMVNDREVYEGRITPPPSMISPLPATPAGSMTPASNYGDIKTPHYDYWADLETENESEADSTHTPRRNAGYDSQRSIGTPNKTELREIKEKVYVHKGRTPFYFDMPFMASPLPPKPESTDTSFKTNTKIADKNISIDISDTSSETPTLVSPLKLTLSRRISECGKKNEWNVDLKTIKDTATSENSQLECDKEEGNLMLETNLGFNIKKTTSNETVCGPSPQTDSSTPKENMCYSKTSSLPANRNVKKIDKVVLNLKKTAGAGVWMSTSVAPNMPKENVDNSLNNEIEENGNYKKENITPSVLISSPRKDRRGRKSKITPKKRTRNFNNLNASLVSSSQSPLPQNSNLVATYRKSSGSLTSGQHNTTILQKTDDTLREFKKNNSLHKTHESLNGEELKSTFPQPKLSGIDAVKSGERDSNIKFSKSSKLPASPTVNKQECSTFKAYVQKRNTNAVVNSAKNIRKTIPQRPAINDGIKLKKPMILQKIDPAQLCNKELIKIDPSQFKAIFKQHEIPGIMRNSSVRGIKKPLNLPKSTKILPTIVPTQTKIFDEKHNTIALGENHGDATTKTADEQNSKNVGLVKKKDTSSKIKSKDPQKGQILPSLSNRLSMQFGVDCTVSIDLPPEDAIERDSLLHDSTLSSLGTKSKPCDQVSKNKKVSDLNMKEMLELSTRYTKSADEQFPEFSKMMKAFSSNKKSNKENEFKKSSLDLTLKIQDSLCIPSGFKMDASQNISDSSGISNFCSGVTFHISRRKKTIDLPTENGVLEVRESLPDAPGLGGVKISLTADSDGIEGEVLKRPYSPNPILPYGTFSYSAKKRGRPRKDQQQRSLTTNTPKPSRLNADLISHSQESDLSQSHTAEYREKRTINSEPIPESVDERLHSSTGLISPTPSSDKTNITSNIEEECGALGRNDLLQTERISQENMSTHPQNQFQHSGNFNINPPCSIQLNNVPYRSIGGTGGNNPEYFGEGINDFTQIAAIPRDPLEEFLLNPVAVRTFMGYLNVLMDGFEFPPEWAGKVDPFIAMLLYRKQDPVYAHLDFDSMMQLYSKMLNHELRKQHFLQQQHLHQRGHFERDNIQQKQASSFQVHQMHVLANAGSSINASKNNLNVILPKTPVPLEALRQASEKRQQRTMGGDLHPEIQKSTENQNEAHTEENAGIRTYAELQPVERTSNCNDGTEVLRRHQENTKDQPSNAKSNTKGSSNDTKGETTCLKRNEKNQSCIERTNVIGVIESDETLNSNPISSPSGTDEISEKPTSRGLSSSQNEQDLIEHNGRKVIKQEILMPPSVASNIAFSPRISENPRTDQSVKLTSVHPNPCRSITEVPGNLPLPGINGSGFYVGKGDLVVSYTFENCCCGPIYVNTEKEVRAIVDLVDEKYSEKEAKIRLRQLTGINSQETDNTGKRIQTQAGHLKGFYSSGSVRARSILSPDILVYIDRSFTQRGMKENVVGRKKKNYPKRSKILKVCPKTGELIYPPGHPRHMDRQKKNEDILLNNIKKEINEVEEPEVNEDQSNAMELEKAVFKKDLTKIKFAESITSKIGSDSPNNPKKIIGTKYDKDIPRDSFKRNATEEEDSEADIELDCYNPATPIVKENIEKILSNSRNAIKVSKQLPASPENQDLNNDSPQHMLFSNTSNMELSPDFGRPILTDINDCSETMQLPHTTSLNVNKRLLSESEQSDQNNDSLINEMPHTPQSNYSASMKVSATLFTSKKNKKHSHIRKRKIVQSSIDEPNLEESNMHIDITTKNSKSKQSDEKSDPKSHKQDDDDFNLCSSKRAQPRATYARSRGPSINTPGSSIHSPAPYRTPSYSAASYSIPSPLSPFTTLQPQECDVATSHQIDASSSISNCNMDINDILVPKRLESLNHPEKGGNNDEKLCSGTTSSSVAEEAKQTLESQSDKILQISSRILELEVDPVQEKDSCNIPLEIARFTIDKPNRSAERRAIYCTANDAKLEGEPLYKIPRQITREKDANNVTNRSQIQTRRRNQTFVNGDSTGGGPISEGSTYLEGKTGVHFESVFKRKSEKNHADRIAAFRKRQEKKREKIMKILAKREAKKATGFINEDPGEGYYKGIGVTDEEAKSKMSVRTLAGKLTKAENIGGVRRVLKPSSKGFEVVELPKSSNKTNDTITSAIEINTPYKESSRYENTVIRDEIGEKHEMDASIPHKENELQKERNLIAELLMIGAKAVEESSTIGNSNQSKERSSIFEEFEMAHTSFSSVPQFQEGLDDTLLDI